MGFLQLLYSVTEFSIKSHIFPFVLVGANFFQSFSFIFFPDDEESGFRNRGAHAPFLEIVIIARIALRLISSDGQLDQCSVRSAVTVTGLQMMFGYLVQICNSNNYKVRGLGDNNPLTLDSLDFAGTPFLSGIGQTPCGQAKLDNAGVIVMSNMVTTSVDKSTTMISAIFCNVLKFKIQQNIH
ncbi:hypothetical protein PoB_006531400 [Plakobranchus ocellatus]|uniref:Uncharacterized protein n=1 Tax=Plakobranchus ocellatus TaxID=259542 RepID=A0AAV4D3T7_9GAST|nr:hypothetical protein PoB_006531400 [Plakobranchus ocellatus]